jgi:hypothetical protein
VIQLVHASLMLVGLVALTAVTVLVAPALGIGMVILSVLLALPLALSIAGHVDLLRMKARYDLSDEELEEFMHLVPRLATAPGFANLSLRERRRRARDAAAATVRAGRSGGR